MPEHNPSPKDEQNSRQKCMDSALVLLSYRPRSQKELEVRLKDKGYEKSHIEQTILRLKELNLINDEVFAENWARSRGNKSSFALRKELNIKGIPEAVINDIDMGDDEQKARELAQKKMRTLAGSPPQESKKKLYAYLQRRGFSYSVINAVLKENFPDE